MSGYCPAHTQQVNATRYRADRDRRGTAASRGYDARHRRWRTLILARDPLCKRCLTHVRTTPATVADHILPLRYGGARFDPANGQGLCGPCNTAKMHEDERTYGARA